MEVSNQHHAPVALSSGKEPPVPIEQEAGLAPEPVWTVVGKSDHEDNKKTNTVLCDIAHRLARRSLLTNYRTVSQHGRMVTFM
jgi:hypothetical protein